MPDWIYAVMGFIIVTVILTLVSMRQKNASWVGTVTDIRNYSRVDSNDMTQDGVKITIQLDSGKKTKLDMNTHAFGQYYSNLKVGDKIIKRKGEGMATKIE